MVGPTKLSTILIQRLDTMLGTNVGQQSSIGPTDSPRVVYQPGNPDNLAALKNPPQQELIEKELGETKHRQADKSTAGKTARHMDLNNLFGRQSTQKSATRSAPTTLGYTARVILALFNKFPESNRTIKGQKPLLPDFRQAESGKQNLPLANRILGQTANANTLLANLLAQNMEHSIKDSGLFYESHLAKLSKGEAQAKELLQQPQNKLGLKQSQSNYNIAGKNFNVNAQTALNTLLIEDQANETRHKTSHKSDTQATQNTPSTNPNDQLQNMVRQQLEVLANQSFIWRGEAWPGAEIECEIKRHADDDESDESQDSDSRTDSDQETKRWSSKLNLSLPNLGAITVNLNLQAKNVNIHIQAPKSGEQLKLSSNALFRQLLARGLQAQQILIENDKSDNTAETLAAGVENG